MSSGSGVRATDECVSKYNELKLGKKLKFITFKLNDAKTEIVVDQEDTCEGLTDKSEIHERFLAALPEKDCRYAVYDFEYDSGEGTRNKLIFVHWASDNAGIKQKMLYSTSKDALRKALTGIATEVQGSDYDDVSIETFLGKVGMGKK